MALVKCLCCDSEISDKAKECPNCGHSTTPKIHCAECGAEISAMAQACPKCGCPVEKKKNPERKYAIIVVVVALLLIAALISSGIAATQGGFSLTNTGGYKTKLSAIADEMMFGAAEAETAANLTTQVWHNSIYNKKDSETDKYTLDGSGKFHNDFNDALSALFSDESFIEKINTVGDSQAKVLQMMKELKSETETMPDVYIALKSCYDAYFTLTDLARNPTGSYNDFSDDFSKADEAFLKAYRELLMYTE